ncbi:hypothetical protein OR1_03596 [Geobacter sp. OR-1]|uniref:hypothetical protein n=1 Tax=Geobacter sp. OR-1 TaxID=1266765 RepID=UPI0005432093|nr:hypothetical protein [Geobacter sp. OR-1]GAM11285.1 hypothetical protein OR1_03596 [Geobacter sp. OR-1]
MIDILLISDQPRLHEILSATGKLPDGTLRIATSLNQGLAEMASRAPDILFLQNRLSGLSGFILVRHVKETGSAATKIVLLTDGLEGSENSSADIELLTGVSDNELSDAVSEIIGDQLGLQKGSSEMSARAMLLGPAADINRDVTDSVSISAGSSKLVRAQLPAPDHGGKPALSHEELSRKATILSSSPPPIQWEKKRLAVAISVVAVLAIIGVAAALIMRAANSPKPKGAASVPAVHTAAPMQTFKPATTHQPVAQPAKSVQQLPAFIPASGIDPAYGVANPGWERYTSAARDYKLFRESGAIRAIQVLDRQATGISPEFFSRVIRETANVRDYRLQSKETKGEYLIKKGKLSGSAEVILYKNRSDTNLRAFVLHFKPQETLPAHKGHK